MLFFKPRSIEKLDRVEEIEIVSCYNKIMGIQNLNDLIKTCRQSRSLSYFTNKRCTVDVSGYSYQFLRSPSFQKLEKPILFGFLNQLIMFREHNITPTYVFDGKPPKEKQDVTSLRKGEKEKNIKQLEHLKTRLQQYSTSSASSASSSASVSSFLIVNSDEDEDENEDEVDNLIQIVLGEQLGLSGLVESDRLEENRLGDVVIDSDINSNICSPQQQVANVDLRESELDDKTEKEEEEKLTQQEIQELIQKKQLQVLYPSKEELELTKQMFSLLGVSYVQSYGEADPILNQLIKIGAADFAVSKDMDILTYNTPYLVTSLKGNEIEMYELSAVLQHLNFDLTKFVDLCILCGCDYVKRIKGIGTKIGYKLLQKHGTIEDVVANLAKKYVVSDDYLEKVNDARAIFNNPHSVCYELHTSECSSEAEIGNFLREYRLPTTILTKYYDRSQPKITDYI